MFRKTSLVLVITGFLFTVIAYPLFAADDHSQCSHAKAAAVQKDAYPLDTCPVSGAKLGSMGKGATYTVKGQEIRLCCEGCIAAVKKDPEKYLKMIEDAKKKTE